MANLLCATHTCNKLADVFIRFRMGREIYPANYCSKCFRKIESQYPIVEKKVLYEFINKE